MRFTLTIFIAFAAAATAAPLSFNRDIRPILSNNCYQCHGPDSAARKAKLRLDREADSRAERKGGTRAIVPGNLTESELIYRITTDDADEKMPPADSHRKLTLKQIETLKQWVKEGGKYERHWSFIPPKAAPLPKVKLKTWPRNGVDHFILARLEAEGLKPSPEADKATLLRRVSFDLIGLPPTLAQLNAFLADKSPKAFEKVVDRLLASPRYGEHMARYWLDAARYADTNGFQSDSTRNQWHWRDWVVDALNRNMPFDQFTIEQLAGDLLPKPSLGQLIATGFNRNHMLNGEGGAIAAETQVEYVVDRVETTGTVWLGLTVGCARCHDHKYDPISQNEFYQLFAFFNALPERGGGDMEPTIKVPTPEQSTKLKQLETTLAGHQAVLNKPLARFDIEREQWETPLRREIEQTGRLDGWRRLKPDSAESANGSELKIQDDASVLATGKLPDNDDYTLTFSTDLAGITGIRLETLTDPSLKGGGPGREGNFVLTGFELQPGINELDLGNLEQRFDSGLMKKGAKRIDIDITSQRLLVLDVGDGDNGISSDWANWGEPILEGPDGTLKLTDLDWHSATTDYREVLKDRNAKGEPQRIDGRPLKWGIGTHAKSRVVFVLPEGYTRFRATVGPDTGALEEVPNAQTSIRFFVRVSTRGRPGKLEPLPFASAVAEFNQDGLPVAGAIDGDPKSGWGIWKKDFDYNQPRKAVFRLKETWPAGEGTRFTLRLRHKHDAKKHLLGRFRVSVTAAPEPSIEMRDGLPGEIVHILSTPPAKRLAKQRDSLARHHRSLMPDFIAARRGGETTRAAIKKLNDSLGSTMVMRDSAKPRDTFLLVRGVYDQPDKSQSIQPGVPASLPGLAKRGRANRLDLARWLTDPNHPLTARVTVNRYWQHFFGIGLVKTTEDFGVQGERPEHPRLLDWLATEFVQSGWNVKHLHRLIVTSATYRQASANAQSEQADPANTWFARAPIRRLSAEQVRDGLLAVSGELDLESGGEGVVADESNRRSIYRKVMRNSPDEVMHTFDSPDHISHMPQRNVTTTATQSLLLLNSEWTRNRAAALAKRLTKRHPGNAEAQVAAAHELAFGQAPLPSQLNDALAFLDACGAANKPSGLAALAEYCHVLMNANAFLYVD